MQQDNRLWILIARKLSGEASQAELVELEAHLGENPSDQYLFEMLNTYWIQHPEAHEANSSETDEKINRIITSGVIPVLDDGGPEFIAPAISPLGSGRWKKWAWAGGVAAMVLVGIWFFPNTYKSGDKPSPQLVQSQQREVMAKRGTRSKLILPDGTQVWLNADTKLTYLNSFNNELREVNLDGEAFFDVVKDKNHPFVVHTSGIDIRVLGTAFNVKSYQQEPTIETTLLRGMIEVTTRNDTKAPKVILRPHEKLVFNKSETELSVVNNLRLKPDAKSADVKDARMAITPVIPKPDSVIMETSWVYNKLIFEGENFREVSLKMERWYNVKISFRDEKLMRYKFKGTFQNETIQQALEALKLIAKFDYVMNGSDVEILRSKD